MTFNMKMLCHSCVSLGGRERSQSQGRAVFFHNPTAGSMSSAPVVMPWTALLVLGNRLSWLASGNICSFNYSFVVIVG